MPQPGALSIGSGPPLAAASDATLGDFLIEVVGRSGPRPALVTTDGRWTYDEVLAAAMAVARGLLAEGVGPGSRVGVLLPNSLEWVAATYGAALIGAVPVLLNVFSTAPEQEVALTLTATTVLVMSVAVGRHRLLDDLIGRNPKLAGQAVGRSEDRLATVAKVWCVGDPPAGSRVGPWADLVAAGAGVAAGEVAAARSSIGAGDDALIMFTSGTSGTPKAVVHGHRAPRLQPSVWAGIQRMRPDERVFSSYPFCWSSGFARSLGATWTVGGCMVTLDHFDPGVALGLMAQERASMAILPGAGHLDLRLVEHPAFATTDLSSLERPSNPILARALGRGEGFRGAGYGLTETFTLVTASPADGGDGHPPGNSGRPLPGWTVKVVDPDTGEVVPSGQIGQIKVLGPALMKRYEGRPPGSGFDGDGFFVTPDLGYMDPDGFLFFASRIDDIVRSAGVNVSTSELERELAMMDGVRLAVAVGIPHPTLGQALVACVVPEGDGLAGADVTEWLRPRIASYKLPRAVLLIEEADLRFTVSQKVQLADLRELAVQRVEAAGLW